MTEEAPEDERDIELSSILAIFPELEIFPGEPRTARLLLEVAPTSKLPVVFDPPQPLQPPTLVIPPPPMTGNEDTLIEAQQPIVLVDLHELEYLPSLQLEINLTDAYPEERPPLVKLTTNLDWLPKGILDRLLLEPLTLWEEYGHSQVVFAFIDFLQQEAEAGFKIAPWGLHLPHRMKKPLLDFDQRVKQQKFDQGTFDCGICLEPKKGSKCHKLSKCGHVFCTGCLQDFYNSAITEGDVASVRCLSLECGKDKTKKQPSLHPRELLNIPLERSQVQRYVDMKLKKMLDSDKNTIFCPRKFCQAPARSAKYAKYNSADLESYPESDDEDEIDAGSQTAEIAAGQGIPVILPYTPPADRLSICSKCEYAFCRICEKSWHGDLIACRPLNAQLTGDELASYDYIRLHTTPCPTCSSPCQKTHGCNHMICSTCKSHFCYLCSAWLVAGNPYKHFNTKGSPCYMKLWEREEGDDPERAAAGDQAARADEQAREFAQMLNQAEDPVPADDARPIALPLPPHNRPGGNGPRARREPRPVDPALQRFLAMAARDEEDDWDSDEMEDEWADL